MPIKKILKAIVIIFTSIFIIINVIIALQAYSLTHFNKQEKSHDSYDNISGFKLIKSAILGFDLPKPQTNSYPTEPYQTIHIPSLNNQQLEAWLLHTNLTKKGLVILFHGYGNEKSSMLDRAEALLNMGYDTMLVDFMGSGGSDGNQTTIGYKEADNVKTVYDYVISNLHEENITLLGFSMGAVAIMKAQNDYNMLLTAIILEAPYASFEGAVNARLDRFKIPHFPTAMLFTFWAGALNGFDAFKMKPIEYSKNISVPVLLMSGSEDINLSTNEIQNIYDAFLTTYKELKYFPKSGHESYLKKYPTDWYKTTFTFLENIEIRNIYSNIQNLENE